MTSSVSLQAWQQELETFRADQWTATGTTKIVQLSVQTVSLDNSDPGAGTVPTVQIDVCYDVSEIDVVDAHGNSVVPADRPDRAWERLQVANYDYDAEPDDAWRVASGETLEKAPCDAA
ncbi:hypothetical protein [Promicromonospora sp. NPDC050249]|uniref:hypothetical protein n=1 Tax=Promicromonospora sp. NPDC050249 TaxID=3154743 RepID=UPI0033ECF6C2